MLPELAQKQSLYELLFQIDQDMAMDAKQACCGHCGGVLHQANYDRKPRGGPESLPEKMKRRWSLCCAVDGCRRRTKPLSVLFMERRVYWRCVILIVTTLRQGRLKGHSGGQLKKRFGMSHSTLRRWMHYFRKTFPSSATWKKLRGRIPVSVSNDRLPEDLLALFLKDKSSEEGVVDSLKFLANA